MSAISCHVLDTARGCPADNLSVRLEVADDAGHFRLLAARVTDRDGRIRDFLGDAPLEARTYRVIFETAAYLKTRGSPVFYPWVEVAFCAAAAEVHYHIPLLLSPFGYSTYRGS